MAMSRLPWSTPHCARSRKTGAAFALPTSSRRRAAAWRKGAEMLPSRFFSELTQPEIAAQFKKNPLVILPAGSVEQHGPHLPTGTDTLAANMIAQRVAALMGGLVLPASPL